jgi:MFS family permease
MYARIPQGLASARAARVGAGLREQLLGGSVTRNVVFLGLTSLFTDISSEMVSTILPLYLVFYLHTTPLQFGMLDGLYQGGAALTRLIGGLFADRSQRYKEVAGIGYGLSAVSKIGLLLGGVGGPGLLAGSLLVDRTGKGIRTAPRDALISLSSAPAHLGLSFAVHRSLDTLGAMLGPLAAFGLLAIVEEGYDVIFVVSLCVALIGLAMLTLFVRNDQVVTRATPNTSISATLMDGVLHVPRFKWLCLAAGALGLTTVSDAFLYLTLQHRLDFAATFLPLLYVATSLVYFLLALPVGRLADRLGRGRVFIAGYALLLVIYGLLLLPSLGSGVMVIVVVLFGAYYAATDGVLMALASGILPAESRTTGLAAITAATGLGSLLASLAFGGLWTLAGPDLAVTVFLVGLTLAMAVAGWIVLRSNLRLHGVVHG